MKLKILCGRNNLCKYFKLFLVSGKSFSVLRSKKNFIQSNLLSVTNCLNLYHRAFNFNPKSIGKH